MQAITAEGLTKVYPSGKKAVEAVSFSIAQGQVFGFLGPNGAGKTTMVKLLTGMLTPTQGSARLFGLDCAQKPEALHQFSGIVTEHAQMYDHLTGLENLIFYATVFGAEKAQAKKRALALLEQMALTDAKDRKLGSYSTGMRQRLSFARAVVHHPKILFLDEPTSGLDPESVLQVNGIMQSLAREQGTTIFLCTHQLRYAQEICSNYGLIDNGTLLAFGGLDALRAQVFPGMTVTIKADKIPGEIPARQQAAGEFLLRVQGEEEIPALVRKIVGAGGSIYSISARHLSLEEIYFALMEKRGKGGTENAE